MGVYLSGSRGKNRYGLGNGDKLARRGFRNFCSHI